MANISWQYKFKLSIPHAQQHYTYCTSELSMKPTNHYM